MFIALSLVSSCSDDEVFKIQDYFDPPGNGCKLMKVTLYPESSELDVTTYEYDDLGRIMFKKRQFTDTAYTVAYHYNEENRVVKIENYVGTDYSYYSEITWEGSFPIYTRTFEEGVLIDETNIKYKNEKPTSLVNGDMEEIFKFTYDGDNFQSWYYADMLMWKNTKFDNKKSPKLLLLSIEFIGGWNYSKNNPTEAVSYLYSTSGDKYSFSYTYNSKGYPIAEKNGNVVTALYEYTDCN